MLIGYDGDDDDENYGFPAERNADLLQQLKDGVRFGHANGNEQTHFSSARLDGVRSALVEH